ncbi:hypothetical protein KOW79_016424 [Hemibagrus wyckioides]|uniref:Ig-like domain-containing protein n=1 Tax=Hemibagrus wyckioides TaxID=337641 RepID=A0A9D3SDN9_9TELE|nr:hypothetical protein KOW79_016424 [Hemibagrus wyckioides]
MSLQKSGKENKPWLVKKKSAALIKNQCPAIVKVLKHELMAFPQKLLNLEARVGWLEECLKEKAPPSRPPTTDQSTSTDGPVDAGDSPVLMSTLLETPSLESSENGPFHDFGVDISDIMSHERSICSVRQKLVDGAGPTAPSVSLLPPSPLQLSEGSASLLCLLSGYSPQGALVSWTVDGSQVNTGVLTSAEEEKSGRYSRSSTLTLSKDLWEKGEEFSCKVSHNNANHPVMFRKSQCEG